MQTKASPRLTISRGDTESPARFTGPCGTVTCEVEEDVLNVYVRPGGARAADWDMACGLMRLIADAAHWSPKTPSVLSAVNYWSVRVL
jgi:hypothetical protein